MLKNAELALGFHHTPKMVPGIIRTSGDRKEEVSEMCQQYGIEIAKQIL